MLNSVKSEKGLHFLIMLLKNIWRNLWRCVLKALPQLNALFLYTCFLYCKRLHTVSLHTKWIKNLCQSKSWFENFAVFKMAIIPLLCCCVVCFYYKTPVLTLCCIYYVLFWQSVKVPITISKEKVRWSPCWWHRLCRADGLIPALISAEEFDSCF